MYLNICSTLIIEFPFSITLYYIILKLDQNMQIILSTDICIIIIKFTLFIFNLIVTKCHLNIILFLTFKIIFVYWKKQLRIFAINILNVCLLKKLIKLKTFSLKFKYEASTYF